MTEKQFALLLGAIRALCLVIAISCLGVSLSIGLAGSSISTQIQRLGAR